MLGGLVGMGTWLGIVGIAAQYGAARKDAPQVTQVKAEKQYFGGSPEKAAAMQAQWGSQDAQALQMATQDASRGQQARGLQQDAYNRFAAMAEGRGPSVAKEMARQGANQSQANANQLAASTRGGGGNQLLAMRNAQKVGSNAQMQASGQSAQLGQQEQLAAMGQLANVAGEMRAGDAQARSMSEGRASDRNKSVYGMNSEQLQADVAIAQGNQNAEVQAQIENARLRDKRIDRMYGLGQNMTGAGANTIAAGILWRQPTATTGDPPPTRGCRSTSSTATGRTTRSCCRRATSRIATRSGWRIART